MMRPIVSIAAAALLEAIAGCAMEPSGCCDGYLSTDQKGIYCLAHKDVVLRFVREPQDPAQRAARLSWFKAFLKELQPLEDSDQIDAKIQSVEKQHPEFLNQYTKQHFWAGRDTLLPDDVRGQLMKCGFGHAVTILEAELRAAAPNP